jgi:hypothetical protein
MEHSDLTIKNCDFTIGLLQTDDFTIRNRDLSNMVTSPRNTKKL